MSEPKPKILAQFEELERVLRLHVDHLQAHAAAVVATHEHVAAHGAHPEGHRAFAAHSAQKAGEMLAAASFAHWSIEVAKR